jgi:hypothetical protein
MKGTLGRTYNRINRTLAAHKMPHSGPRTIKEKVLVNLVKLPFKTDLFSSWYYNGVKKQMCYYSILV